MKEKTLLVCQECSKKFYLLPCQMKNRRGRFCSKLCLGASKRHGSQLFCALCDSQFYRRFGEQDVGKAINQFCSRKCYKDWRIINADPCTYLKDGAIHIHRIVAASILGRELTKDEVVHHIDENRKNNVPENLAVFPSQSHHSRCHGGKMSAEELDKYRLR